MVFMYLFTFFGIVAMTVATTFATPFLTVFGLMAGANYKDVVLPYNESEGLVWEYDGIDDPYVKLEKMTVNGNEQVFRFVSAGIDEDDDVYYYNGRCMELDFTAKNGQSETYYAVVSPWIFYDEVFLAHEDETITYTVTAERSPTDSEFEWEVDFLHSDLDNVVHFSEKTGETNTFTLVYFNERPHHDGILEASFFYDTESDRMKEWHSVEVDFSSGEAVVIWESGNSETNNQEVTQ